MARYIDLDKLTARLPVVGVDGTDSLVSVADVRMILAFAEAETGDVVEVVRCKECDHSDLVRSCSKYECRKGCGTLKYANDFCSYGKRKSE